MNKFFKLGFKSSDESNSDSEELEDCATDIHASSKQQSKPQHSQKKVTSLKEFLRESNTASSISSADLLKKLSSSNVPAKNSSGENQPKKLKKKRRRAYDSDSDSSLDLPVIEPQNQEDSPLPLVDSPKSHSGSESDQPSFPGKASCFSVSSRGRSSMTFGDLLCAEHRDTDIKVTTSGKCGGSCGTKTSVGAAAGAQRSIHVPAGNDDWMEGEEFDNITSSSSPKECTSQKRKGRLLKTKRNGSQECKPSRNAKQKALVTTVKNKITKLAANNDNNISNDDNSDDDVESYRPFFPGKPPVTQDASPLLLKYKEKEHDGVGGNSVKCGLQTSSLSNSGAGTASVPCFTMRYLKSYQVRGVQWLWGKYSRGLGELACDAREFTCVLDLPQCTPHCHLHHGASMFYRLHSGG